MTLSHLLSAPLASVAALAVAALAVAALPAAAARPIKAWCLDQNADGHVETAFVRFDGPLPAAPDMAKIAFAWTLEFTQASWGLRAPEVALVPGDPSLVRLDLKDDFAFGHTGFLRGSATFGPQPELGLTDTVIAVEDSAAPVLAAAVFQAANSQRPNPTLRVLLSEDVPLPLSIPAGAFVFRKASGGTAPVPRILAVERTHPDEILVTLDPASGWLPTDEDSLALGPDLFADPSGNVLKRVRFTVLNGLRPFGTYEPLPTGLQDRPAASRVLRGQRTASPWLLHGRRVDGSALGAR